MAAGATDLGRRGNGELTSSQTGPRKGISGARFAMVSRLGGFFHSARSNARGADAYALMGARFHHPYRPQIRVPAAAPGIVSVAHHVSVARTFPAVLTLQCHNSSTSNLLNY